MAYRLHRVVLQSNPATQFTTLATGVAEEEKLQLGGESSQLIYGNISEGTRGFIVDSIQLKVLDDDGGGLTDQEMDLLFFHSSAFDSATFTTDAFIGHVEVPGGTGVWEPSETTDVYYWEDHDINLFIYDSSTRVAGVVTPPRVYLQIKPITGKSLHADDTVMVQICLIECAF